MVPEDCQPCYAKNLEIDLDSSRPFYCTAFTSASGVGFISVEQGAAPAAQPY
jgi:hypothetical protein